MSYNKNRRIKERKRDRKYQDQAEKDMEDMKKADIMARADKKITSGIVDMAAGKDILIPKKKNRGLVEKFKRLLKFKKR